MGLIESYEGPCLLTEMLKGGGQRSQSFGGPGCEGTRKKVSLPHNILLNTFPIFNATGCLHSALNQSSNLDLLRQFLIYNESMKTLSRWTILEQFCKLLIISPQSQKQKKNILSYLGENERNVSFDYGRNAPQRRSGMYEVPKLRVSLKCSKYFYEGLL